jgi:hypothetical protein
MIVEHNSEWLLLQVNREIEKVRVNERETERETDNTQSICLEEQKCDEEMHGFHRFDRPMKPLERSMIDTNRW